MASYSSWHVHFGLTPAIRCASLEGRLWAEMDRSSTPRPPRRFVRFSIIAALRLAVATGLS